MNKFEKKLTEHSESILSSFNINIDIKEEFKMASNKNTIGKTVIIAAAALAVLSSTAFAAYKYLSADKVADEFDKPLIAQYFKDNPYSCETVTDGDYRATLLGVTSGKALNAMELDIETKTDNTLGDMDTEFKGRTYAVVAVERADGKDMSYEESSGICISPLIEGYKPWQLNIATMHGGYMEKPIDGVMYRMIECDDIECFADKKMYIAVTDENFISNSSYSYDEESGYISENPNYKGTNILFELKLDPSLADKEKAEAYIQNLMNDDDITEGDISSEDDYTEEEVTESKLIAITEE